MGTLNLSTDTSDLERKIAERKPKEVTVAEGEPTEISTLEDEDQFTKKVLDMLSAQGCTREDIARAKEMFGHVYFYPWSDDKTYVFRPLARKEWSLIRQAAQTQDDIQVLVIERGVIYPNLTKKALDDELAGMQDLLSEVILKASGFIGVEEALATVREL